MRGNVMDMAVGIIIGVAFVKIVSSFVSDVLMPPVGILLGGVDFSNLAIVLKKATDVAEAVTVNYGVFINTLIDFIIIAIAIFMVIKQMNKMKKRGPAEPTEKECPRCCSAISIKATRYAHCTSDVQ
jgi:large conductance mechanosensitive channel